MERAHVPVLYGFVAAALLLAAGWRPWRAARAGEDHGRGAWAGALAVAAAYLAGYWSVNERLPSFPPRAIKHWVPLLVLASVALCPLRGTSLRAGAARVAGAAALLTPFLFLSLARMRARWEGAEEAAWLGGLWVVGVAHYAFAMDLAERRPAGRDTPLAWMLACVALAVALGQSTSESALLMAAVTCVPGGWFVLSLWRPDLPLLRGASAPLCGATFGLALTGVVFADTSAPGVLLILAAPQLARLPLGTRWRGTLARALLVALVGACGAWLSWADADPYLG